MPDVYVEYEVSSTTRESNAIRIFAKVPRAKIEAYRRVHNDQASSDNDIAHNLSELPALSVCPQPHWLGSVKGTPCRFTNRPTPIISGSFISGWLFAQNLSHIEEVLDRPDPQNPDSAKRGIDWKAQIIFDL